MNDEASQTSANEIAALRAKIEELELKLEASEVSLHDRDVGRTKMLIGARVMIFSLLILVAVQSLFAALDRPTPIRGPFAWVLLSFAVIYLTGFVVQLAMVYKRKIDINAEVSRKGSKLRVSAGDTPRGRG